MTQYRRSPSTRWTYTEVKIEPAARPQPRQASAARSAAERSWRSPYTVQIRFRGGAECWWEISAPGLRLRLPGHVALHDALKWAMEGGRPVSS